MRTFKQVGMHFKDAFQEIVPNGTAELIIRKENPESEEFNGVGIRVRFGGGGESLRMGQLSGGQKAVVALALIFAIQVGERIGLHSSARIRRPFTCWTKWTRSWTRSTV